MTLTKEQEAAVKRLVGRMAKIGLGDDDGIFDDRIHQMKRNEALMLIQHGTEGQVRYMLSCLGGARLGDLVREIEDELMDHVPSEQMSDLVISCGKCSLRGFKEDATLDGQSWVCPGCKE
jgi:hypothetical protein